MKNSFLCYINLATVQKRLFDESIDNVKDSLTKAVEETSLQNSNPHRVFKKSEPVYSTGWLKGSLSYPWAIIVGIIIPSFFGNKF